MGFGACKICLAKDALIASLEEQIIYLRAQIVPDNDAVDVPYHNVEANNMLSGETTIQMVKEESEEELQKSEAIIEERDRILSGTY